MATVDEVQGLISRLETNEQDLVDYQHRSDAIHTLLSVNSDTIENITLTRLLSRLIDTGIHSRGILNFSPNILSRVMRLWMRTESSGAAEILSELLRHTVYVPEALECIAEDITLAATIALQRLTRFIDVESNSVNVNWTDLDNLLHIATKLGLLASGDRHHESLITVVIQAIKYILERDWQLEERHPTQESSPNPFESATSCLALCSKYLSKCLSSLGLDCIRAVCNEHGLYAVVLAAEWGAIFVPMVQTELRVPAVDLILNLIPYVVYTEIQEQVWEEIRLLKTSRPRNCPTPPEIMEAIDLLRQAAHHMFLRAAVHDSGLTGALKRPRCMYSGMAECPVIEGVKPSCLPMLPCTTCSTRYYCSSHCRDQDWERLHSASCPHDNTLSPPRTREREILRFAGANSVLRYLDNTTNARSTTGAYIFDITRWPKLEIRPDEGTKRGTTEGKEYIIVSILARTGGRSGQNFVEQYCVAA